MKKWSSFQSSPVLVGLSAFLLGVILTFAFAPYEIFPLALLAPAGLIFLLLNVSSAKKGFCLGFIFGLGFFGSGVYWVFISIHDIGEVPIPLSTLITGGFIAILALFPALTCYFCNRYFTKANTAKIVFAFPVFWITSEWVRSWIFSGFPWLILGYSQTNSPLRGFAPIFSVFGVSLALIMSSSLLINAWCHYKYKAYHKLYLNLFTLALIWIVGSLLGLIPWTYTEGQPLSAALVQGNIPQAIKWSPEHLKLSFDRYQSLSEPLWGKEKLIIWPEAAVPLSLQNAQEFVNAMDEKAKQSGSQLILGIPIETQDQRGFYNAIITLGQSKQFYLKRRLVPYGEYIPFEQIFSRALSFMDIPMSNMVPGNLRQSPLVIANTKILPSICYEIAFPELMRTRDMQMGFLLTLTNDAWFGHSNAEPQHLQMAQMRALELGRPVVFVSNDGITAFISADGKIESAAPRRQAFVLKGTVQPMQGITPWMRNGLDPLIFILFCLLFMAIRARNQDVMMQTTDNETALTSTLNTETNLRSGGKH